MSLIISLLVTVIAVVTACVTIGWLFYRDWKRGSQKAPHPFTLPHIDSEDCGCLECEVDRIENEE